MASKSGYSLLVSKSKSKYNSNSKNKNSKTRLLPNNNNNIKSRKNTQKQKDKNNNNTLRKNTARRAAQTKKRKGFKKTMNNMNKAILRLGTKYSNGFNSNPSTRMKKLLIKKQKLKERIKEFEDSINPSNRTNSGNNFYASIQALSSKYTGVYDTIGNKDNQTFLNPAVQQEAQYETPVVQEAQYETPVKRANSNLYTFPNAHNGKNQPNGQNPHYSFPNAHKGQNPHYAFPNAHKGQNQPNDQNPHYAFPNAHNGPNQPNGQNPLYALVNDPNGQNPLYALPNKHKSVDIPTNYAKLSTNVGVNNKAMALARESSTHLLKQKQKQKTKTRTRTHSIYSIPNSHPNIQKVPNRVSRFNSYGTTSKSNNNRKNNRKNKRTNKRNNIEPVYASINP